MSKQQRIVKVEKPVVSLPRPAGGEINLWVLDAGQHCHCADQASMQYYAGKTGSLVYETKQNGMHQTCEYSLHQPTIWDWVQKWMRRGQKLSDVVANLRRSPTQAPDADMKDIPDSVLAAAMRQLVAELDAEDAR